jgi:hypothetical protein
MQLNWALDRQGISRAQARLMPAGFSPRSALGMKQPVNEAGSGGFGNGAVVERL